MLYDFLTKEMNLLVLNENYFVSHLEDYERACCGGEGVLNERVDFLGLSKIAEALVSLDRMSTAMETLQEHVTGQMGLIYKFVVQQQVLTRVAFRHEVETPALLWMSGYSDVAERVFQVFFMLLAYVMEGVSFLYKVVGVKTCLGLWDYFETFFKSVFCGVTNYQCVDRMEEVHFLRVWFSKAVLEEAMHVHQKPLMPSEMHHAQYQLILPCFRKLHEWLKQAAGWPGGERFPTDARLFMEDFLFRNYLTSLELEVYKILKLEGTLDYVERRSFVIFLIFGRVQFVFI